MTQKVDAMRAELSRRQREAQLLKRVVIALLALNVLGFLLVIMLRQHILFSFH